MVHIILHTEKGRGWLTRRVLQSVTETQSHKHRVQLCACMNTTCIFTWRRPVHRASSRPSTLLDIYLFICGSQDLSLPSLLLNTAHAFLLFSCFLSDFVLFPFSQSVHIICVCVCLATRFFGQEIKNNLMVNLMKVKQGRTSVISAAEVYYAQRQM